MTIEVALWKLILGGIGIAIFGFFAGLSIASLCAISKKDDDFEEGYHKGFNDSQDLKKGE